MHFAAQTAEEVLAQLRSRAGGLSAGEVVRRLAEFGPNRVEEIGVHR